MAITTNAELLAAAANWLARSDLTSRIPEFVALAEAKFNRTLRTRDMLVRNSAFSVNGEYVSLPVGFLEPKAFSLNVSPRQILTYESDDSQILLYQTSGKPKFYSIVGPEFHFGPVPDATYVATLTYFKALTPLATTSPNWLLTSHPDVYLYGTLLESAPFLGDDARIGVWAGALERVIGDLRAADSRSKYGNGMAVRVA